MPPKNNMHRPLTDAFLNNLKAPKTQVEYKDTHEAGLRLVVGPRLVKSWSVVVTRNGKQSRVPLGRHPLVDVRAAREHAALAKSAHDPSNVITLVSQLFDAYTEQSKDAPSTAASRQKLWAKYILPTWGKRKLSTLSKPDAVTLLNKVLETSTEKQRRKVLLSARPVFAFGVDRQFITANPFFDLKMTVTYDTRERVLTLDERKTLMKWSETAPYPVGPMVKFAALTGVRLGEAISLRRSDLRQDGVWTVTGELTDERKRGTPLKLPLTRPLLQLIAGLPRLDDDYVFSYSQGRHMVWSSDNMTKLRKEVGFDDWSFHTLRHTFGTLSVAAGGHEEIVNKALGHKSTTVTGRYNHDDYLPRKLHALQVLADAYTTLDHEKFERDDVSDINFL